MAEQRWVFVVRCLDQSGVLSAVASVFANRGVSLEAILGSGIAATRAEDGRLILSFRATERKKDMLRRVLERLSAILQVAAYRHDDPQLRAIAVVKLLHPEQADLSAVLAETISQTAEAQTLLLTGSTVAIETVVQQLRQQELLLDLVMTAVTV
ncbi:MAG: ACT domain-containing protein [Pegethrix bostrychoides GSE-TBD4-15B]|jgi:acetolactate synthase small subunit|uniref:ACT domain-containing protein n=1 Tax=Pegethrix bostrychoides GSE-TBD4-15B TaxID=2839662 RepID=A0A951P751_9CYAN|nr:ACT domain-containing protein [Pegethrix bostrychoides GSE-TBD4-15B]